MLRQYNASICTLDLSNRFKKSLRRKEVETPRTFLTTLQYNENIQCTRKHPQTIRAPTIYHLNSLL